MMEFIEQLNWVSAVAIPVFTLILGIMTFLYKWGKKLYSFFDSEAEERKNITKKVDIILSELTPNHGSSLKDKVGRIENSLHENTKLTQTLLDRQRWILDNQETAIFECDESGLCIWTNDAYKTLLKRDSTELIGNGWRNFIHESDRERVVTEWDSAITEGRSSQSTFKMVDRDGKIMNVNCYATKHANNGFVGNLKIIKEK